MVTDRRRAGLSTRPHWTLSGQLLIMQLGIVLVMVVAVGSVALAQSGSEFARSEGRRATGAAELLAGSPLVRTRLEERHAGEVVNNAELATQATALSAQSGIDRITLVDPDGRVVASTSGLRPGSVYGEYAGPLGRSAGGSGRAEIDGIPHIVATAPVLSDDPGQLGVSVGSVIVASQLPSLRMRLMGASNYLLTFLGIASVLGGLGSWLVARRIKRQTLGMEPKEITALAEYREAVLGGIAEGVIALDQHQRITMINDVGRRLLELSGADVGRAVTELGLSGRLLDVLTGASGRKDELVLRRGRVLIMNRMSVRSQGRSLGSVTTLRDRTEMADLERELGAFRSTTELLRAQAHEFDNRLHIISGLIEIGDHEQVVRYVEALSEYRASLDFSITKRLRDSTVAALVLAKTSAAAERRLRLRVSESSSLGPLSVSAAADVATVVGNLVDNAMDAVAGSEEAWVELDVHQHQQLIQITVRDSGPGVAPELAAEVFTHGFTTKAANAGERGIGLALTRRLCRQRSGDVELVGAGEEAHFVARLLVDP